MDQYLEQLQQHVIPWGINIVLALAVFVVGKWLAKVVVTTVRRVMTRSRLDDVLVVFLGNFLHAILIVIVIIAALDQLGVDTKSALAIFAAAGLAVGLALKDSLSNFAAGVMIVMFKPFRTGNFVEAGGVSGIIDDIGIFNTVMHTGDNCEVTVPNAQIYSGAITNYSARETRRIDLVIGIGYGDDIKAALTILEQVMRNEPRILQEPAPVIMVSALAESSVDLAVRPWVATSDYWPVRSSLLENIKAQFDQAGISIPFPQRDVHMIQGAA
ncbi:MAG: mechanosensitive ion channel [Gammaproteobacteria bacterium]